MISDSFWNDPDLVSITTEQRHCLVLFLSCPDSNVIGVYRTVWRSVGAGMGWTQDQTLNAARDLKKKELVDMDEASGWIWVKEWWKHNSLRGAFTGNVAGKALREFNQVPDCWKGSVRDWIHLNDLDGICIPLLSPLGGASKGLGRDMEGAGSNHTSNSISTPTTNLPIQANDGGGGGEGVDLESLVDAAVWASSKNGLIRNESGFRHKVRTRIQAGGPSAEDIQTLSTWRSAQAKVKDHEEALQRSRDQASQHSNALARDYERVEAVFNALEGGRRDQFIQVFAEQLASSNESLHRQFKKHGVRSPLVKTALLDFLRNSSVLDSEAHGAQVQRTA